MTKKIYWAKPYQKIFTGKVLDVKNGAIILNKTLFFATAGNQIHDTGIITISQNKYHVINVEKDDDGIFFHFTDPKPTEDIIGLTVKGHIDWDRRYSIMKAHTAQHIISAIMVKQHNINTIHANIKPAEFSIEFGKAIAREQMESVMNEANLTFTLNNKKVTSHVLNHDDAAKKFSSKIRGMIPKVEIVRILEISETDFNTCGGTHIKDTSEIGIVSIAKIHRDREVEFYCGENAIKLLSSSNANIIYSQTLLNCSIEDYPHEFQKNLRKLQDLNKKQKDLSVIIMNLLQTNTYEEINGIKVRYLEVDLPKKVVFSGFKKFEPNNTLILKHSPTQYLILSSAKKYPAKMIVEKLIKLHGGKGGGSSLNAQILFDQELKDIQKDIKHILSI